MADTCELCGGKNCEKFEWQCPNCKMVQEDFLCEWYGPTIEVACAECLKLFPIEEVRN